MKDILYVLEYPNFWDIPCFLAIKWHKETWRRKHEHAIVLLLWDFQLRSMCDRIPTEKHVWDSNINFYLQYKQTGSSSIASQVSTGFNCCVTLPMYQSNIHFHLWLGRCWHQQGCHRHWDILWYPSIFWDILKHFIKIGIFFSVWGIILHLTVFTVFIRISYPSI